MTILVSAQEPAALRAIGGFSPLCEQYGSDILFLTQQGEICGVQRKAISDLVNSLGERLNRELAKMAPCDIRILLVEGCWRWTQDGESLSLRANSRFHRHNYDGLIRAVQHDGFWVVTTDDLSHTIEWCTHAEGWFDKSAHVSLGTRPKPPRDMFGGRDSAGWRLHFWQTFEGIGAVQAKELDAHFNGKLPFAISMSRDEWMAESTRCKGVGTKRAETIWKAMMGNGESMGEKT